MSLRTRTRLLTKRAASRYQQYFETLPILDIVVKRWRLLPTAIPPLLALEPQHDHRHKKRNVDQGKRQPGVLVLNFFTKWNTVGWQTCQCFSMDAWYSGTKGDPVLYLRVKGYRHGEDATEGVENTGDLGTLWLVTLF